MVMGQMMAETEVLVIGAGPGGYVAAIRAAQLGFDVMLVDKAGELGGMCLHHGCIPSKALIHATKLYDQVKNGAEIGIVGECTTLDFGKTQEWKASVIQKLYGGIKGLCEKHNIQIVQATAHFENESQVLLQGEGLEFGGANFRNAIIATGSKPRPLPDVPFEGRILSSHELLELDHVPGKLIVIGGGYIGIELGAMLAKAGTQVTIVEAMEHILGAVDEDLSQVAEEKLKKNGIDVRTGTKMDSITQDDNQVTIVAGGETLTADYALIAIGHMATTEGLQLELAKVELDERGFIKVDEQCRTSNKNVYAVGDVTGGVMLAHKASAQGQVAAEAIAEQPVAFEPQAIPAVIFSDPEIGTVGLREKEAKEQYGEIQIGKFPFAALGKAIAIDEMEGFVKVIADSNGTVVGVHAVGPGVTDYISEAALAIEMGATAEDLALTIHPHPTLSESMSEASEALLGRAIHMYQPKE